MRVLINEIHDPAHRRRNILLTIYAVITLVFFYSYMYNDILETTQMGIQFWVDLFDGRIRYFYDGYTYMDPYAYAKDVHGVYDFPIYILFAIWDLPLYLVQELCGIDVFRSLGCMIWIKTMLLVFCMLFAAALYRLARAVNLSVEDALLTCIFFYTSNLFMTSIVVQSAYDITAMLFTILGVTCWMRGNMRGFVANFMLAIPLKMFALLIFLPLLVLRQKNIWKILISAILSLSPILICRILIPCSGNGASLRITDALQSTDLSNLALLYAIEYHADMVLGEIYYSVVGFGILIALCYFAKPDQPEQYHRWGIYICFLSYAILFMTCISHPYWIIILTPFVMLVTMMNKGYLHINLLLEMVSSWGIILAQMFYFPWCFANGLATNMFWSRILGIKDYETWSVVTLLSQDGNTESIEKLSNGAKGMGSSIYLACMLMMIVLNCPWVQDRLRIHKSSLIHSDGTTESWVLALRVLSSLVLGILPLVMYVLWMRT